MHPTHSIPYSWRNDPRVPAFDDGRMLVVMDGTCALCSRAARRIAHLDKGDRVRITTVQAPLGQSVLQHFGLRTDDPETWLMLKDGQAQGGLDATIDLFPSLNSLYLPLRLFKALPRTARDWLYQRIARNRYSVFGRADICALPDPELRKRLIL